MAAVGRVASAPLLATPSGVGQLHARVVEALPRVEGAGAGAGFAGLRPGELDPGQLAAVDERGGRLQQVALARHRPLEDGQRFLRRPQLPVGLRGAQDAGGALVLDVEGAGLGFDRGGPFTGRDRVGAPAAHQRQQEVGADAGRVEVVDALAAELRLALLAPEVRALGR